MLLGEARYEHFSFLSELMPIRVKKINIWWKLSFIVEIRMLLQKIFHPIVMYISWRWCEQTSKSWCSDDEGVSFERRCLFIWQTRFFPVVLCTVRTAKSVQISFLYFVPWINLLLVRFLSNFLNYFSSISWISGLLEIFFLPEKIKSQVK